MSIQKSLFGTLQDGSAVDLYQLDNGRGLQCGIITLGGIVTELRVPDRESRSEDIVLGLPSLAAYLKGHPHFGALTGRVAGRINGARFTLDGKAYSLAANDPPNHLHGGPEGIDKRNWRAEADDRVPENPKLKLTCTSPDGDMGFPGNVTFTVTYSLTPDQALRIDYRAVTDAPTPLSLTNHSYFNLRGEGTPDLSGHELQIFSDTIVPKLDDGTLTDTPAPLAGGVHDFRSPKSLKAFADQGQHGENYLLDAAGTENPKAAAVLTESKSGRKMEVFTTANCLQLYTSQTLGSGNLTGKSGKPYPDYAAVCLECQGYPNGVNHPEIEDIVLRPGAEYRQTTLYKFSSI